MKKLRKNSLYINDMIEVCWPHQPKVEEIIDMTDIKSKFNGAYSVNNSTICFVVGHEVFVTPHTHEAMTAIMNAGLVREYFYVPFSNGEYPKYQAAEWKRLQYLAKVTRRREYEEECAKYADAHGIGALHDVIMERCFRIPETGVPVKRLYYNDRYYPICNESCFDSTTADNIGHYCTNNGRVVFIYRDGGTYVAKGYGILNVLRDAGYTEAGLFVPFSNGEQITDPALATKWENLKK